MAEDKKLTLFKDFFRGRQDVFPVYWENKAGRKGYSPVCNNKFKDGLCVLKNKGKCEECPNQKFVPPSDNAIKKHFAGSHLIGGYPLLPGNTCHFIVADFDDHEKGGQKNSLQKNPLEDAKAFLEVCDLQEITAYIERSKSGEGFHVWIFFQNPVPAWKARLVLFAILKEAQVIDEDINLGSFDRLFPNQDALSGKGLGNLIALPFYGKAVKHGNSTFLDADFKPVIEDDKITSFMDSIERVPEAALDDLIEAWSIPREKPRVEVDYVPPKNLDPQEGLKILEDKCKFVQHCRDNQPKISEPLWRALGSNLARFDGGRDKFHEFSCKHPEYSKEDTDKKLDDAFKASRPITCAKIREDGFNCGMDCGVKAPAGLAKKRDAKDNNNTQNAPGVWEEQINKMDVPEDRVRAILAVKDYIVNELLTCDQLTVKTIIKNHLKKKFSLDGDDCKELLKKWKDQKRFKAKASKDNANSELDIKVFEKDGRICKIDKDFEEVFITSFTIEPLESITIPGEGETLRVNLKANNKTFHEVLLPPGCWCSSQKFMQALPGKETVFTGGGVDPQHIRLLLSIKKMPHKVGVRTSGFQDGRFITEEGALSSKGVSDDIVYFNEVATHCKLITTTPATVGELSEIGKYIDRFNIPTACLPVLGWTTACFLKPVVTAISDEMGLGNGFPLLNIQGEAGAGKTGTVKNILMRIWAIGSEPKSIGELTKFTMMRLVDSSNTIPAVLEENKSSMQSDYHQNLVSNLVRSTYNCLEGERGRADQTTQIYRYHSPVVIVGETGFTEPALLDRFVTVFLSKKDSEPHLKDFQRLRQYSLEKLGRAILEKALRMKNQDIKSILESELVAVDQDLADRPRTNAAMCRFGLRVLGDVLGMEFDLSEIDKAVKDGLLEGDSLHRKSAVDKILEAMCLMSEYRKKDRGYRDEIQYIHQDYLESDLDYEIIRESELFIIRLHVHGAYPKFLKWAKAYQFGGDILPESAFKKQLTKEKYCISKKPKPMKIGNHLRRGIEINIDKMEEKDLLISDFWKPDKLPF